MTATARPEEGDVHTFERTFTHEDVERFGEVSGDRQAIHTEPDDEGRLVVQGLLTATLPTKIGGDLGVLARTMEFEFRKPVYTDETITCEVTVTTVTERDDRYELACSVDCHDEDGTTVMRSGFEGLIWKDER
ncbi:MULTISPECIES: MaoC/PaaZ C-terminal domain-containing protein [Halococcus]|uniref:MaoC domain-containing protein dehydratase n=1 Tax=Halococcus salifodinae DSM 8989 TaxID=1227456 RepID=M0N2M1_9EURY|nr:MULTISPECIES: MaoC/PaaZ C-terminal domain-containing protein [Halococcus]EMA50945.1 MaoC domain-containing protein dehydratase [Halococcus salifodinae DSM 8989]